MLRSTFQFFVLFVILTTCTASSAAIKDRRFSVHLRASGIQPALNDSAQVWLFTPAFGGDLQYMISQQTGIIFSVEHGRIFNDSVSTSVFKFRKGRANRKWMLTSVSLGPKFYLNLRKGITPFVMASADFLTWKVVQEPGGRVLRIEDSGGEPIKYSATELGATAGFGFEQLIADRLGITLGLRFTYLTGVGTDFAQSVNNARSRGLLQFDVGFSLHFGGHKQQLKKKYGADTTETMESDEALYRRALEKRGIDTAKVVAPKPEPDKDTDHDGVVDRLDHCPDTPEGAEVDSAGCPKDSDGDGVYDGFDKCPGTPTAARGMVDAKGCPLDSDQDGVPDFLDKCADTPTAVKVDSAGCPIDSDFDGVNNALDRCPDTPRGVPVDQNGCPDFATIFYKRTLWDLFRTGETKLAVTSNSTLDSVAVLMKMFKEVTATIYGYTDDVGPDDANLKVSQKRADAVLQYFLLNGIGSRRMRAIGKGESNFLESNRTRTGRDRNRRIEIEFTYPQN